MKNSCFFTGLFPGGTRLFQRCTGFSWQNEDENWIPHGEPPPRARRPPPTHRTSGPPSRHGGVPRASDPPESVCTRQKGRRVASAQRAADAADGSDSAGAAHGGEEWKATHHSSRLSSSNPRNCSVDTLCSPHSRRRRPSRLHHHLPPDWAGWSRCCTTGLSGLATAGPGSVGWWPGSGVFGPRASRTWSATALGPSRRWATRWAPRGSNSCSMPPRTGRLAEVLAVPYV